MNYSVTSVGKGGQEEGEHRRTTWHKVKVVLTVLISLKPKHNFERLTVLNFDGKFKMVV